jgi:AraC-like DNA-binding protein
MVKTGHPSIRRVRFLPPESSAGDIEVNTLRGIRDRGGPHEFLTPQRLDFDLLVHIESGSARHTVDFTDYTLRAGDVLWVRAGQVHHWGAIADIEGTVAMFGPHTVDERTRDLIRSHLVRQRNHWPAADLADTPVSQALDLLALSGIDPRATQRADLRQAALAHCLAALLVQLALVEPGGTAPAPGPTHEAYAWFRDHIEEHFRSWHKVGQYADRLGYSTRTLNRLARQHTGLSAKELIDERVALEAKRQLCHADASVSEIAEQLGFDDASNFSSYFLRQTQLTPGTFRIQSRSAGTHSHET